MTASISEEIESKRPFVEELCREFEVNTLELFGSAVNGEFQPDRSDLDFIVEFERPPKRHGLSDQFFGLYHGLEDLFGRKVDLLEKHLITNPFLVREIVKQRRTTYAA